MVKTRICKDSLITFTVFKIRNLDVKARKKKVNNPVVHKYFIANGPLFCLWRKSVVVKYRFYVFLKYGCVCK